MTSGTHPVLATVAALLALATATLQAAELDGEALLASLARPAPDTTGFVEVRHSALLVAPMVIAGQLEHRADGALVRRVESPFRETTELRGENVVVEREGNRPRRFSLDRAPELRGMLASFGALLSGDAATLRRHFAVVVHGEPERWQIELTPRDDRLRARLASIVVDGTADRPSCFTLTEPDGDATIMALGVRDRAALPASLERDALRAWCADAAGR
jgi:hypothetical protein